MKRLLFTLLFVAAPALAVPKTSIWGKLSATMGLAGLGWYFSGFTNPSYAMDKKPMVSKKLKTDKANKNLELQGYHTAINADNHTYNYKLMAPTQGLNFRNEMQEVGNALILCTRFVPNQPNECTLERLYIEKKYRYQKLGSLLLQEAVADARTRTDAVELAFTASALEGTNQERLEQFYKKNGAVKKQNHFLKNAFAFNLRDNKI